MISGCKSQFLWPTFCKNELVTLSFIDTVFCYFGSYGFCIC